MESNNKFEYLNHGNTPIYQQKTRKDKQSMIPASGNTDKFYNNGKKKKRKDNRQQRQDEKKRDDEFGNKWPS